LAPIIEARGICKQFGGVQALQDVAISVEPGQVVGLIGPNGAGKSTLVSCITGMIRINSGSVHFRGEEITRLPAFVRARRGIGRTFQKLRLAGDLTVYENVVAGLLPGRFRQPTAAWLRHLVGPLAGSGVADLVYQALVQAGIEALQDETVSILPYGQRHFVELARALASQPDVLLLDEPATGLTEAERERLVAIVKQFCATGRSVILIEHDLGLVGRMCDRVTVLDHGQRIFSGTPAEAQQDQAVVAAYLGTSRLAPKEGVVGV
jgi:branched-chain amino acid transport system ATP-binding protein